MSLFPTLILLSFFLGPESVPIWFYFPLNNKWGVRKFKRLKVLEYLKIGGQLWGRVMIVKLVFQKWKLGNMKIWFFFFLRILTNYAWRLPWLYAEGPRVSPSALYPRSYYISLESSKTGRLFNLLHSSWVPSRPSEAKQELLHHSVNLHQVSIFKMEETVYLG